eukprot:13641616-Alexandrium_andersonii.AAC.1
MGGDWSGGGLWRSSCPAHAAPARAPPCTPAGPPARGGSAGGRRVVALLGVAGQRGRATKRDRCRREAERHV